MTDSQPESEDSRVRAVLRLGRPNRATERAAETIALGLRFADDLGDTTFDSRHLLWGLFREPDGVAHAALANLQVAQEQIDDAIRNSARSTGSQFTIGDDIRTVLSAAFDAADEMSHTYVGTEHLLIGVVADGTESAKILEGMRLTRGAVTKEVHDILGHGIELPKWITRWLPSKDSDEP